jgi:hypothetical protein
MGKELDQPASLISVSPSPRNMPPDWTPPAPAWAVSFAEQSTPVVMAYFGTQFESHDQELLTAHISSDPSGDLLEIPDDGAAARCGSQAETLARGVRVAGGRSSLRIHQLPTRNRSAAILSIRRILTNAMQLHRD